MMTRFNKLSRRASRQVGQYSLLLLLVCAFALPVCAQFNSGSDGSDGAFNPTTNVVIDMADHPTGIYNYSSVNIPTNVTVSFMPNANNTPVVWLMQSNAIISGIVDLSGQHTTNGIGGIGGPGGWPGGNGGTSPTPGLGPGGGTDRNDGTYNYGNQFLIPLLGGSGGGGAANYLSSYYGLYFYGGAGGGGGALLIASSSSIQLNGQLLANGGSGNWVWHMYGGYALWSGSGSGGGIRLATTQVIGNGSISAARIRIDSLDYRFGGSCNGSFTKGYQPIIIPVAGQGAQLAVVSVAGVAISASPSGQIGIPDAVISAQQTTPVPIVVRCSNIPLNTQITVTVKPVNGLSVSAVGYNTIGTLASSTATISINMPRSGGIIYATAATSN